jgi:hypothetical protein
MCGALSDERTGLSFTIAAGPRQRSHSRVRVPRHSWPYLIVSDSTLPQLGGPGPRIYIPQEQGGPVIPSCTGFPFRRFLRFAGLQWNYSNLPPRGRLWLSLSPRPSLYILGTDRIENTAPNNSSIVVAGRCLVMARLFIETLPLNRQYLSSQVAIQNGQNVKQEVIFKCCLLC